MKENILRRLADTAVDEIVVENWRTEDHQLRELGENSYLLTYILHGQGRVTRRATIWRHDAPRGWHVLYHQGSVVAAD